MAFDRRAPSLLALACLLAAAAPSRPAEAKCTPRPDAEEDLPEIVRILDGEVVSDSSKFPPDDLDRVEVICWKAVERYFGVRVRFGAILVLTKTGAADRTLAGLSRLISEQDRHLEKHGEYARDIGTLALYEAPPLAHIYMRVTEEGWTARVRHDFVPHLCFVFVGTAPEAWQAALAPSEPGFSEREPVCLTQDRDGLRRAVG